MGSDTGGCGAASRSARSCRCRSTSSTRAAITIRATGSSPGVGGTLGLGAGALIGKPDKKGAIAENEEEAPPRFDRVLGGGLMPVSQGIGAQMYGVLW